MNKIVCFSIPFLLFISCNQAINGNQFFNKKSFNKVVIHDTWNIKDSIIGKWTNCTTITANVPATGYNCEKIAFKDNNRGVSVYRDIQFDWTISNDTLKLSYDFDKEIFKETFYTIQSKKRKDGLEMRLLYSENPYPIVYILARGFH